MKKILLFVLVSLSSFSNAQSIVINPSFENYIAPGTFGPNFGLVTSWTDTINVGSPDYHHTSQGIGFNLSGLGPCPNGNQCGTAFHGDGVVGLYYDGGTKSEWLQGQLSTQMQIGQDYSISFYLRDPPNVNAVSDSWGILFSDSIYQNKVNPYNQFIDPINWQAWNNANPVPSPFDPSTDIDWNPATSLDQWVEVPNLVNDTNWVQYSFTMTAQSNHEYIYLGMMGDPANFQSNGIGGGLGSYVWYDSLTIVPITNSIDIIGDSLICNGDSTVLEALNDSIHNWAVDTDPSTIISSLNPITVSPSITTTYLLYGSSDTISYTVTVEDLVAPIDLGNDTTLCPGQSLTLDGTTTNGIDYLWQDNSTDTSYFVNQAGTYWVEASNNCNTELDSIIVNYSTLSIDLGPDLNLCNGDSTIMDAGNSGALYLWNDGSTDQTLTLTDDGDYWVVISDGICSASDTVSINTQELTAFFTGDNTEGCAVHTVNFMNESTVNVGTIDSVFWAFGNSETSNLMNPSTTYLSSGNYDVSLTVTTNLGCTETLSIPSYILVHPPVEADFDILSGSSNTGENLVITNNSINADNWYWDFGDNQTSTLEVPLHEYQTVGAYTILLVASNNFGCSDSTSRTITISSEPILYVPNAFSPDEDEFNNTWKIFISNIDIYDFTLNVYNRWGETIWSNHNPSVFWDGTYSGKKVPTGTYTWTISFGDLMTDERYEFNGHVTLIK
ncbi:MAG: PKD domain-containing protein [Crocinitomicaceae bacterium]|nr:PKD domain-containing protein [Crocinitomicaceae bacterium]